MEEVERLLEVIRKELGADDARLELGGKDPGEGSVWCALPSGFRLVAILPEGERSADELVALREKLVFLARSFDATLDRVTPPRPRPTLDPQHALDDALDVLTTQTGALAALVVDNDSPVFWGSSLPRGDEDVRDAERAAEAFMLANAADIDLPAILVGGDEGALPAELDKLVPRIRAAAGETSRDVEEWRRRLTVFAATSALREATHGKGEHRELGTRIAVHDADLAYIARGFGGIYWLLLAFDVSAFSELHAEAAMIHALPWVERLVTSLPPIDPDGGGGRVVKLRRLRPV